MAINTLKTQHSLTREQKEAVGLLSIGTFLEYFDLMLYVHMAVLLNELFFPISESDDFTYIFSAIAFSSTFVFRPIGALIIGWLGDNIGRRFTVIITTAIMSITCLVMAFLLPYSQIGITATVVVTCCRIMQGISSMGEILGAELYISEICKDRRRYFMIGIVIVCSNLGGNAALGISSLILSNNLNWRIVFFIGASVALVGVIARTAIRETPDFINAKLKLDNSFLAVNTTKENIRKKEIYNSKINKKVIISYFFMETMSPIWFYIGYFYSATILKTKFLMSAQDIIFNNLLISFAVTINFIIICFLLRKMHPLRVMKIKMTICFPFLLFLPYLYQNVSTPQELLIINIIVKFLSFDGFATVPVVLSFFPVLKRFTYGAFFYSCSKAIMYVIMSFGIEILSRSYGSYGIIIILLPFSIGYAFSRNYLEKLEKVNGNYY